MTMTLTDFLLDNPVDNLQEEIIVAERFKDSEGNPLKFRIKAVPAEEFTAMQKKYTKISKKGKTDFDNAGFNMEIILDYTVEPDFRNADAIKKAGCLVPKQFVNKVLKAGEVTELVKQISALSGFEDDVEDLKEEAKN